MAIQFVVRKEGETLLVCANGFDESLEQVQQYGMEVITAALEHGTSQVLCDERDLEYRLGTFDTYSAAAYIAANAPAVCKVALVCNPAGINDAKFWETVAVNRGLTVRVFKEMIDAQRWLGLAGAEKLK
jgi:hypothetical protein